MTNTLVNSGTLSKNSESDYSTSGNLPVQESKLMSIDMANASFIMESLTNLYGDPHRSVVREYIANAIDSHIEAGNPDPVEVTVPDQWSPTLVIKDQGIGMSLEGVYEYGNYGTSKKRENLNVVGNFGMGSKSALAITNSFTITAIKDGEYTMATIGRNDDGAGQVNIINHEPTTEPNGVTITIPISPSRTYSTQNNVNDVIKYLPGGVVSVDGEVNSDVRGDYTEVSDDVFISEVLWGKSKFTDITIVTGGFGYAVPYKQRVEMFTQYSLPFDSGISEMIIDAPIGSVDLTPSREELRMTAKTTQLIEKTYEAVIKHVGESIINDIKDVKTYSDLFAISKGKSLRNLENVLGSISEIAPPRTRVLEENNHYLSHIWQDDYGTVSPTSVYTIEADLLRKLERSNGLGILVENDKNYSSRSLLSRIGSYMRNVNENDSIATLPVVVLNSDFEKPEDWPEDKSTLLDYINGNFTKLQASDVYAKVNEYNKSRRTPGKKSASGTILPKSVVVGVSFITDEVDDWYSAYDGVSLQVSDIKHQADELGFKDATVILNDTKASGLDLDPAQIRPAVETMRLYGVPMVDGKIVLIDGGSRTKEYFEKYDISTVSASDFVAPIVSFLQSKRGIAKVRREHKKHADAERKNSVLQSVTNLTGLGDDSDALVEKFLEKKGYYDKKSQVYEDGFSPYFLVLSRLTEEDRDQFKDYYRVSSTDRHVSWKLFQFTRDAYDTARYAYKRGHEAQSCAIIKNTLQVLRKEDI